MSGLFSGRLDFVSNKKDFDFDLTFYEQTTKGEYAFLGEYWARASYVGNLSRRRLLKPGKRHHLDFTSVRLMSHQLLAGSRLVAVLSIIKGPGRQINYGTGNDVSDETIQDAKTPLEVKWYGGSYIDFPIGK
jgi:hypothetical protein